MGMVMGAVLLVVSLEILWYTLTYIISELGKARQQPGGGGGASGSGTLIHSILEKNLNLHSFKRASPLGETCMIVDKIKFLIL